MPHKGLFSSPEEAVSSIQADQASRDLPGTARRAVRATLWLGAHYGYELRGDGLHEKMPDDLRQTFLKEVDRVLEVLSNYAVHYPGYDPEEEGPSPVPLSQDQILAVEYHNLRHFMRAAGLGH
jgi:hypothetical protein